MGRGLKLFANEELGYYSLFRLVLFLDFTLNNELLEREEEEEDSTECVIFALM